MSVKENPKYQQAYELLSNDNSVRFVCKQTGLDKLTVAAIKRTVPMVGDK